MKISIYVLRNYMATDFQTYKQINNGCNCEHVSVGVFSCKRWGRSKRQVLKFLIQAFGDVALSQLIKATFRRRIILLTYLGSRIGRNFTCFSKRYYLFQDPIVISQVPPCSKNKRAFKCWNSYYFFGLSGTTVFISYFIIDFHFIFRARCSFLPCVGKTILIWIIL